MKKIGFDKRNYFFEDASGSYSKAISGYKFKKFWNKEKMRRILSQKVCLYCEKKFKGDKGAVLHHRKMQGFEKEANEKVFLLKREFEVGKLSKEEKDKEIKKIENELIGYYRGMKDTDLICVRCHGQVHVGKDIAKSYIQKRLFF